MTDSTTPSRPLRILFVEDSADDLALLVRSLRKAGFDPSWEQVEDEAGFRRALESRDWDVVLADYSLPSYSAAQAIGHLREIQPYLPMIVVSGNVGEETAVAVVKAGAGDYVMKDSLARLAPAIDREIREAMDRRERDSLVDKTQRLSMLALRAAPLGLIVVTEDGTVAHANAKACEILRATEEEIIGARMSDVLGADWEKSRADQTVNLAGTTDRIRVRCGGTTQGHYCCVVEAVD